jgi:uncharacterized protein YbjQ (UPF0145 family)
VSTGAADAADATGSAGTGAIRPRTPSSDLTVAEAAALRRLGLAPVGFVMGSAVVQLVSGISGQMYSTWGGFQVPGAAQGYYRSFPCVHGYAMAANVSEHFGFNAENVVLESSVAYGYELAITRLQAEAQGLGAHGVVGVDVRFEYLVGAPGTATFLATGTAVVHPGTPPLPAAFATNASGQHFERLVAQGFIPSGLAVGVGVIYVQPNCAARGNFTAMGANAQLPEALAAARGRAREALASQAHRNGEGVVHTSWTDRRVVRYGESWNQMALAVGTAVRRFSEEHEPVLPRAVVPLRP